MELEKTTLPMEEPTETGVGELDEFLDGLTEGFADEQDEVEEPEEEEVEEPEQEAEVEEPEETVTEEPESDKPAQQGLRIKYNGEEKDLTYDEAIVLAQKGMNYDHVADQLTQYKSDEGLALMRRLAKEANMDYADYVKSLGDSLDQKSVAKLVSGGMSEADAKQAVQDAKELARSREELAQYRQSQARRDRYVAFAQAHPEVDLQTLPQEVLAAADKGDGEMERAYAAHQHDQDKKELEALRLKLAQYEQAEKNKKTSAGSAKGAPPKKKGDQDPFLEGLYTPY